MLRSRNRKSKTATKRVRVRLQIEHLETRRLLASSSAPAILQWFDGSFDTIEARTPDIFNAGYGSVWVPPPGRADSGGFSVGYDVYDRFDLGKPDDPTIYGTETGLKKVAAVFDAAGVQLHVDAVLNHAGFSDLSTPGFAQAGGYPGLAITLPNAIDGDFHSSFDSGDLNGRLSGLVDLNHGTNHQFIRHPIDPADANNLPAGTTPAFGRLANVPDPTNRRFYPDRNLNPMLLFDPVTNESGIQVYPFNPSCDSCGDPVTENALGYEMRYMQWLIQEIGVDGLRLDAAKHYEKFVLDYLDRAVYRANPRLRLDGSVDPVFSYGEVFDSSKSTLLSYVKKNINPNDPGRIGGNRDVLDFSAFFAMRANLGTAGTANAWINVRDSLLDLQDDGLHNGSAGVLFVSSHDENGPGELGNVAHAFSLMYPGNTVVYFNGKEFGDNRDFPKDGRGDALGGVYGDSLKRLVQIRNTHGRGNFLERWIDTSGIYVYERESSAVVGLSNRGDNGFDQRTVTVAFAPGTKLTELTGNASNSLIDPFDDIPQVVTVSAGGTIDIRVPRNRNANGVFHGNGYVVYGLPTPQASAGLELTNVANVLAGSVPAAQNYANGVTRLSDLNVITADSFGVRLMTNEVRLLGLESLRDVFADGDNAILRLDGGVDLNGNGRVDFVTPNDPSYGFEAFGTKSSPLVGPTGMSGPRGDGEFLQTIDARNLSEGIHFIDARAFRHRTDGGPAVYSDFRESIYVDRLKPVSAVKSFEPYEVGVNENRDLIIKSVDKTANSVHVFLDLPASLTDAQVLAMVSAGQGSARQIDRDQFIYGFNGLAHGNHVATIVSFEQTGNSNVQRTPGLFTSTIVGLGLGDIDLDGDIDLTDKSLLVELVSTNDTQFNAAADFNGDGRINQSDLDLFYEDYVEQLRGPVDFGDAPTSYLRPYFSPRLTAAQTPISLSVPGGNVNLQSTQSIPLNGFSRDDSANDSLYFRFTANPETFSGGSFGNAFAGLQLWDSGQERIGFGNRFGSNAWSYFGADDGAAGDLNSSNHDSGSAFETVVAGQARTILVRVQYRAGLDDEVTIWMQPNDTPDSGQVAASTTTLLTDASFDEVRLRLGSDLLAATWSFSNIMLAKQLKPGPAHLIDGGLKLGLLVDPDGGQQTSATANGDDSDESQDDDGVAKTNIARGQIWPVTVTASVPGKLDGWIDYNRNGRLDDPGEHIAAGISVGVVAGTQIVNVSIPANASVGTSLARFRISSSGNLSPTSYAADGEIEDYQLQIIAAPTAVTLTPSSNSRAENTSTASAITLSTITVTDDAIGTNTLTLSGPDAASFEIIGNALRLRAGVVLDFESKTSYSVRVNADDTTVGTTPDAFANFVLTITDIVEPVYAISATSANKAEGNSATTPYTFTVTRDVFTTGTGSVKYAVSGAVSNPAVASDFQSSLLPTGTVTFAANETSKVITINVLGDTLGEQNEGFIVTLNTPNAGTISTASATGNIVNDDTSIAIAATSSVKGEGNSATTPFTFTVTRSGNLGISSSANYTVTGHTAPSVDTLDFGGTVPSGTVTFTANESSKVITVNVAGDTVVEGDENFRISLTNPSAGTTISTSTAIGTLMNDDTSYTIGATSANVAEGNSGSTPFTFTVTRSGVVAVTGSVKYAVTGSAPNPAIASDFQGSVLPSGTVTFVANETSKVITVNVLGDAVGEQSEGFIVSLNTPISGTITTVSAVGNILNDDAVLSIAATSANKAEGNVGNTPFTFTVTRSGNLSIVSSANYVVTGNGTMPINIIDVGGIVPSGSVNFAIGESTKVITINVTGDTIVEPDEGFRITLSGASVGTTILTGTAVAMILNDDTAYAISATSASKPEGNGGGTTLFTFTVARTGVTSGLGSVKFSVAGSGSNPVLASDFQGNVLPAGTVSFAANETSKVITINVLADALVEHTEGFVVTLSDAVNGIISTGTATGSVQNDD